MSDGKREMGQKLTVIVLIERCRKEALVIRKADFKCHSKSWMIKWAEMISYSRCKIYKLLLFRSSYIHTSLQKRIYYYIPSITFGFIIGIILGF